MLAEQQQGDAGDAGDGGAAAAAQLREATAHGELWWRCCGLEDDVAAVLINCYERYTRVEEGYPGPSKEILIDVPRTMPQHPFFASADGQAALARILHAYSQHDPSIAYVQGMGYIAAQLLLHLPEPRAFCVMVCVMQDSKFALRDLLADSLSGLRVAMYQVSRLIEKHYPRMAAHFAAMGVDSHLFFPEWALSLFVSPFMLPEEQRAGVGGGDGSDAAAGASAAQDAQVQQPDQTELLVGLWDVYFTEGRTALFRIVLMLLAAEEDSILATQDFEACVTVIRRKAITSSRWRDDYQREQQQKVQSGDKVPDDGGVVHAGVHPAVANAPAISVGDLWELAATYERLREQGQLDRDGMAAGGGKGKPRGSKSLGAGWIDETLAKFGISQKDVTPATKAVAATAAVAAVATGIGIGLLAAAVGSGRAKAASLSRR